MQDNLQIRLSMDDERRPEESAGITPSIQFSDECEMARQEPNNELLQRKSQSQLQLEQDVFKGNLWRSYYEDWNDDESCPSESCVAIEYDLLKKAWLSFSDVSQNNQGTNIIKQNLLEGRENITVDELKDYVRSLAEKLDQSHGKTRRYFDKFCSTLNSHSAILEVLPNQSQYVSIFCGVVKTLFKASENYQKTAEGLSKALAEIGDTVHLSVQHAKLVNTSDMQDAVSQLYDSVFIFLREAILWYKGKRLQRLRKSFDQTFYDHFSDLLDKIKQRAGQVHIRGNIGHHAKMTDAIGMTRSIDQKLDRIMITQEEDRKIFRELQLSQSAAYSPALPSSQTAIEGPTRLTTSIGLHDAERVSIPTISEATELPYDRRSDHPKFESELEQSSRKLEIHILNPVSQANIVNFGSVYFENKVVYAIRDWIAAAGSQLLRVVGPSEARYSSVASEISASVAKTAFDSRLPSVYLCCNSLPRGEERSIISTLYSLIHQLINQIDSQSGAAEFSTSRIQELDGTTGTWDKAISTCLDLLVYAPSKLLIIIDGMERLDGEIIEVYVDTIINLLHEQSARPNLCRRTRKVLKVLFTTAGPCASLNKLDDSVLKTINIQRQNTKRRPGEPRLGRSLIQLPIEKQEG